MQPGKVVKWVITAERFPQDSNIYLRFFEKDLDGVKVDVDGCMAGSTFNHGIGGKGAAGKNGRLIQGKVKLTSHGSYGYEVRYIDAAGDHLLVEEEIVVEGTPEIPTKITRRGESGLGNTRGEERVGREATREAARQALTAARKSRSARQPSKKPAARRKRKKTKAAGKPKKSKR